MAKGHTYPALEQLKQEADGLDILIQVAPGWLEEFIEYTFEMEYLERKRDLVDRRDTIRERYTTGKHRIESTYGTAVNRALDRRRDGEQPSFSMDRLCSDLEDAKQAINELKAELDEDYLTIHEKRVLQELREEIYDAREYARTKKQFNTNKQKIVSEIQEFESRFERYEDRDRYMISSDLEFLIEQSEQIWRSLSDMSRELKLHVLPDKDASWLGEQKSKYNALVDALPEYNKAFVRREREEYADALTSAHGPLNDRQQKAVIRNDRRNLIDASAGTGKTLTLTHRFLYLLEKGVPPERIVAITYMGDAAEEMKTRIAEETGVKERNLNISTIHSFAREICMEAAEAEGSDQDIGEAREALVERYLEAAMTGQKPQPNRNPKVFEEFDEAFQNFYTCDEEKEYIDNAKPYWKDWEEYVFEQLNEFVGNARTFDLSASDIRAKLDESHAVGYRFGQAGACLVEAYEQIVDSESTPTDFEDMIRTAKRIVEQNPQKFGQFYEHILVDEYQDVSESTLEFIDSLVAASDDTHMFCVGDDWQSIMGFTGSNVRYFTEFEERYQDVTYTSLKLNYRCPPQIVEAGSDLIAQSQAQQNQKQVEAAASSDEFDDEETMQLHLLEGIYESRAAAYAADRVDQAIDEGYGYDEIMVLSHNDEKSKYMSDLREELENRDIPHTRPDNAPDYYPEYLRGSTDDKGTPQSTTSSDGAEQQSLVTLQSVHSSKGTEAPVVIFLHAVGNDPDGIPIKERTDPLLQPSKEITSEHIPEERRLFYVALTRAEDQFQAIAKSGSVTEFIHDIEECFTRIRSNPEIRGKCVEFEPPKNGKQPYNATLNCGTFEVDLLAWPNNDPPELIEGETYTISDPVIDNSDFGEEIRYDKSDIKKV